MNTFMIFLTFLAVYLGAASLAILVLVAIGFINATRNPDFDFLAVDGDDVEVKS